MSDTIAQLEAEAAFRDAAAAQRALVIRVDAKLERAGMEFSDDLSRLARGAKQVIATYQALCETRGVPFDPRKVEFEDQLPELQVPEIPQERVDRMRPTLLMLRQYADVQDMGIFGATPR